MTNRSSMGRSFLGCFLFLGLIAGAHADEPELETKVGLPTLGGKQLWTDQLIFRGWRVQQHAWTKSCRLLNASDRWLASGSLAECQALLQVAKQNQQLKPIDGDVVVVLHGLGRSRDSMAGLCEYLRAKGHYTVVNFSYASTRAPIASHAASLQSVLRNLSGARRICLVGHSMGNLVIRRLFRDLEREQRRLPIHRVVMLAPPNRGATLADRFESNPIFRVFWGVSGIEISEWESLAPQLAVPTCEFGIIAGGTGQPEGSNPLIDGDDDFVVSVAETQLRGARDFVVVPALHAVIMNHPRVQQHLLRFLREGHFVSAEARRPLLRDGVIPREEDE